jgi:DNA polymerase III subunit gamma/tau
MGQALYRKHRPKKLSEVVGQEHITKTLQQALRQGRISHAYLFTGPRGVGKTSVARILAHEINGLPYTDDSQHMDIIEIDAASNRRIDEIRELRDKVYVAPTSAKYKVYIIDEVHMLTREAFNALLKTLEEPPAHVVFILATTDAHKLPETIISRTQRFSFKPVDSQAVIDHLRTIAKQEKITVSDDALQLLAEHGEGSFRDSISLLDQASSQDSKLGLADVQQLLGIPPATAIEELLTDLSRGSSPAAIMNQLTALYDQGFQAAAIANQLGQLLRRQLIDNKLSLPPETALRLLAKLLAVPAGHDPERLLEIILLESLPTQSVTSSSPPEVAMPEPQPETEEPHSEEVEPEPTPKPATKISKSESKMPANIWSQVLEVLKQRHNTLYGIARMAQPHLEGDNLELVFAFAFHQKRFNEATNQKLLRNIVEELTGRAVTINCSFDADAKPPAEPQAADGDIATISNIFGNAELLES